jgi:hypothetical protein
MKIALVLAGCALIALGAATDAQAGSSRPHKPAGVSSSHTVRAHTNKDGSYVPAYRKSNSSAPKFVNPAPKKKAGPKSGTMIKNKPWK